MKFGSRGFALTGLLLCSVAAFAAPNCLDAADEPHHQVLFSNGAVRIMQLDLLRLQSTKPYCYAHPFMRIVVTDTKVSTGITGQAMTSRDWKSGEARFIFATPERVVRNESNDPHREIIIETRRAVEYRGPFNGTYDTDEFSAEPGSVKDTWSTSFSSGGLTATKSQLGPGADLQVGSPDQLLIALDDLDLTSTVKDNSTAIHLSKAQTSVLRGGNPFRMTNSGRSPVRFILVEF